MQAITLASNKTFKIIQQSDAINFLSWFLNILHSYLSKKYNTKESIVTKSFQGKLLVETFTMVKDPNIPEENLITIDEIKYTYESKIQNF
jgi:U4/U6.U5 tri-snRNP-associated protein 2